MTTYKSKKGYTLIELMVGVGLISLITVGVSVVVLNMQNNRKRQELLATLTKLQIQFENNLKNDQSWNATLNRPTNSSLECVRRKVQCNGVVVPGNYVNTASTTTFVNNPATELILMSNPTNIFFDGRSGSLNGFTETGVACTGFTLAASGNSNCPIGYISNWRALSNDINPQILVSVKMIYNPANNNSNKAFINAAAVTSRNSKFDVAVLRTRNNIVKNFNVVVPHTPSGGGNCASNGFGACPIAPAWHYYSGYSDSTAFGGKDDFDLVTTHANGIVFQQKGRYRCSVVTSAFGVGTVVSRLQKTLPALALLASKTELTNRTRYEYANLQYSVDFDVETPGVEVRVSQNCSTSVYIYGYAGVPGWYAYDATANNCGLGFASTSNYSDPTTSKASISCSLLE